MLNSGVRIANIPLWLVYVVIAGALLAASLFTPRDIAIGFIPAHALTDVPKAALRLVDEMIKLIMALNTAMLGAAAAVTVKGREWTSRWGGMESFLIVIVFACGAVSYFGIYLCYSSVLSMVGAGFFNPTASELLLSLKVQYLGTITGVFLLGVVFARILEGRLSTGSGAGGRPQGSG